MARHTMPGIDEDLSQITLPAQPASARWGQVTYPPGGRLGPRRQRTLQLVAVHAGSARIRLEPADDEPGPLAERRLSPGRFTLLLPGRGERFRFDDEHETVHSWCHLAFGPGVSDAAVRRATAGLPDVMAMTDTMASLKDLAVPLSRRHSAAGQPRQDQGVLIHLALAWLASAASEGRGQRAAEGTGGRTGGGGPTSPAVRAAEAHMIEHLDQRIDLDELAAAGCLSPNRMITLFKRDRGHTPIRWLWRLRTHRALELLRHTGLSLEQIAARTGFATPYHLSRKIKQLRGASPSQLRQQWWGR